MPLTYDDLVSASLSTLGPSKERTNRLSVLAGRSGFLQHLGLTLDSRIGNELLHQPTIDSWLATKQAKTASGAKSRLGWWGQQYRTLLAAQGLPTDPNERLTTAISQGLASSGLTKTALANEIGVALQTLHSWATGKKLPSRATFVERLEVALGLLPGTLATCQTVERRIASFCPQVLMPAAFQGQSKFARRLRSQLRWSLPTDFPSLGEEEKRRLIMERAAKILNNPVREHHSRAGNHHYGLQLDEAPKSLQRELDSFFAYKTNPVEVRYKRPERGRIRSDKTLRNWRSFYSSFFGWYLLPSALSRSTGSADLLHGAGGSADELTLGLFAVPKLLSDYLHWISYIRTKAPTHTTVVFLQKLKSLLHPDTGWLIQNPELIARVPERWLTEHHAAHLKFLEAEAARVNPLQVELERARARIEKAPDAD